MKRQRTKFIMQMMRLVLLALFVCALPTHAQETIPEPDTKWWWAGRESARELIAFNAEGDSNVIAHFDFGYVSRVNNDTALGVLSVDGAVALYKLTPQSAIRLAAVYGDAVTITNLGYTMSRFRVLASAGTYAIVPGAFRQLWLVDLTADTAVPLDMPVSFDRTRCAADMGDDYLYFETCVRFSEDGRFLRYAGEIPPADENDRVSVALRERNLATGEEHTFYIPPRLEDANYDEVRCEAGAYGEQWLCHRESEFELYPLAEHWLVNLEGETRTLLQDTLSNVRWSLYFSRDRLILVDKQCIAVCLVDVYSPSLTSRQPFLLPDAINYAIQVVPLPNDGVFIRDASGTYYTATAAGEWQELGRAYCCDGPETYTPDYDWVVTLDEGSLEGTVWDLATNQATFHLPPDEAYPSILYTDYGIVINSRWLYYNGAESPLELPFKGFGYGWVEDMLADGTLIYEQRFGGREALPQGIYRYDPAAKTYTPLVLNATMFFQSI
jgi:hypothetical protein